MSEIINVIELHELIEQKKDFFLLDVRTPEEYRASHLKGHLIPLAELPNRTDELPKDQLIVIHCRSGKRSLVALEFLKTLGFSNLKNLEGGIEEWHHIFGYAPPAH